MNDHAKVVYGTDNRLVIELSHTDSQGHTLPTIVFISRDQARELLTGLIDKLLKDHLPQNHLYLPQPIQPTPFTKYTPPAPHEPISQADGHAPEAEKCHYRYEDGVICQQPRTAYVHRADLLNGHAFTNVITGGTYAKRD